MTLRAPQPPRPPILPTPVSFRKWRMLAAIGLVALSTAGCLKRGSAEITGSIPAAAQDSPEAWRQHVAVWGPRFEANPGDPTTALQYARGLRALDQKPQAVAVLQQAAIRNPKNQDLLAAYGKALSEVGRYKEAAEVLSKAHVPERPDWRILSAQGAVADQTGDHKLAQEYYEAALKLVPGEPTVLSNLGLSYALSKQLDDAEKTLRQAAEHPKSDERVHRNFALVLILKGKFQEAEDQLRRDMSPEEASTTLADLRGMASAKPKAAAKKPSRAGKPMKLQQG